MAKLEILAGTTSKTVKVFIQNNSVTTGAGLTGLAFGTSGLTAYYIREGAGSTTAISLVTATLGTWTSSGFIVVDGTNMPGVYELDLPNAAIASGAKSVLVYLQGATNMAPVLLEIELTAVDNQSAGYGLTLAKTTNITGFNDITAASVLTTTMTESYSTQGAAFTLAQGIYDLHQMQYQKSITGTTLTVLKRDEATTAKTATLNSATAPTSIVEAT